MGAGFMRMWGWRFEVAWRGPFLPPGLNFDEKAIVERGGGDAPRSRRGGGGSRAGKRKRGESGEGVVGAVLLLVSASVQLHESRRAASCCGR